MKIYAIGDLHGRLDLLEKAIDFVVKDSNGEQALFVVLGDMVDRGPDSAGVIRRLMSWDNQQIKLMALQGNHEDMMYRAIRARSGYEVAHWRSNGGEATIRSYTGATKSKGNNLYHRLTREMYQHAAWLEKLPASIMTKNYAFVHAGFDYTKSSDEQEKGFMQWIRREGTEDTPLFEGRHVVHGHEQYASGPMRTPTRTNLDTFAWLHGTLAVGVFDDDIPGGPVHVEIVEGDPDPQLYATWNTAWKI